MAHPYLKARTKQKWIESAKHLRIPPSPTVWACGFSRGSVKKTRGQHKKGYLPIDDMFTLSIEDTVETGTSG